MYTLDFGQKIIDKFTKDQRPVKKTEGDLTLGGALVSYLMNKHLMGLSDADRLTLESVGPLVAGEGKEKLTSNQYDALKRMTDNLGKITDANGNQQYLFVVSHDMIAYQIKDMIDSAEKEKEKEDKK